MHFRKPASRAVFLGHFYSQRGTLLDSVVTVSNRRRRGRGGGGRKGRGKEHFINGIQLNAGGNSDIDEII